MSLTLLKTFFMRNIQLYLILFIAFNCSIYRAYGQQFEQELSDALKTTPKFEFRLDSRSSFINQTGVRVFGVKAGVQFDEKLSFGLGYNFLSSSIRRTIVDKGINYKSELKFRVFSPYLEYVFYRDEYWELSIPVQFGFGHSFFENLGQDGPSHLKREFVVSYEPAITFQYRILSYFGVGAGVGYRLMIKPNSEIKEQFTSPVYLFKVKVYFQDILNDLRTK